MSLIYVFAASRSEGRPVEQLPLAGSSGNENGLVQARTAGANRVTLIITGIGPRDARTHASAALGLDRAGDFKHSGASARPDAVIVIGLCGALSASLHEAAIVAYSGVLSIEVSQPPLPCTRILRERITSLLAARGVSCELAAGITSPRMAVTREEKLRLAENGASVVDMESYEILSAAAKATVPAVVLRVVSDTLDARLPDFNCALSAEGRIETHKAAPIALRHPLQTAKLLLANRRAMERLSKALEIVLQSDIFENLPSISSQPLGAKS
ncbi:MAG TPA: hypothetical protein VKV79_03095 [Terriglobia bacterium]|nr:hypothetical protein [Terriglobia bacterium]